MMNLNIFNKLLQSGLYERYRQKALKILGAGGVFCFMKLSVWLGSGGWISAAYGAALGMFPNWYARKLQRSAAPTLLTFYRYGAFKWVATLVGLFFGFRYSKHQITFFVSFALNILYANGISVVEYLKNRR